MKGLYVGLVVAFPTAVGMNLWVGFPSARAGRVPHSRGDEPSEK